MEFVEGETLSRLIDRQGPLDPALALNIIAQVADGLQAVYESKLVHRDIKPSNIVLQPGEKGTVTAKSSIYV
jgi:eukaryotic-like serine/threonine-protein kinase